MKTGHREVMQMALDALEQITPDWRTSTETLTQLNDAIEALEAALAQPEPEPVAWGIRNSRPTEKQFLMMAMLDEPSYSTLVVPLYTAPPQRKPLSDSEIDFIVSQDQWTCDVEGTNWKAAFIRITRAIEAAHGIGGDHA